MALAAAISSYLVREASFALMRVSETYLPLMRAMGEIEAHQLEQELVALELFADLANPDADAMVIERRLAQIKERGVDIDDALGRARQLVADAGADPRNQDRLGNLVRLEAQVTAVDRQHQNFEDQSLRTVAILQAGGRELGEMVLAEWHHQEEMFNQDLMNAVGMVSDLTLAAGTDALTAERRVYQTNLALTVIAAVAGLLLAGLIVRGLVRPVRALVNATQDVERGNLHAEIMVSSRDEIGQLARSFNHMLEEMRGKERIKDTFGHYVDPRIVESLLGNPAALEAEGQRQDCTVFFSDITGFTGLAELLTPAAVLRVLNSYFTAMSEPIRAHQGIIDKYIGDAIMAFWAPPFTGPQDHALLACQSALAQRDLLAAFGARLPELTGLRQGVPAIGMRIGIATGEVVVGNVGSEVSKNYTVIGDTVNQAARLEALNKHYDTQILLTGATEIMAREGIETREIDLVAVAGRAEPIRIFELLAAKGGLAGDAAARRDGFEAALAAYRERDWATARVGFEACTQNPGGDPPAQVFLERLDLLAADPPGADWGGVWRAPSK